jgi:signal transduction histidine kinase
MQKTSKSHSIILKLHNDVALTGNRYRIGEVLTNFLTNAIKYSKDANEVIVSTKAESEKVTVTVKDFGTGIPPESQEKIFDQFYRISDSKLGSYPGPGLAISKATSFPSPSVEPVINTILFASDVIFINYT